MPSESIPDDATHIKGPNFDNAINLQELLESYEKIGFQATGMAKAIQIVERMVSSVVQSLTVHPVLNAVLGTAPLYSAKNG